MVDDASARIYLSTIRCIDDADEPASAEPDLWTIFKVYGDIASAGTALNLSGHSTVVATVGNQWDLSNRDGNDGLSVVVPMALSQFRARFRLVPLELPIGAVAAVSGAIGMTAVSMEADETPACIIAADHRALNMAVQQKLDQPILALGLAPGARTSAEFDAKTQRIGDTVRKRGEADVSASDWLNGVGNQDDKIGATKIQHSRTQRVDACTARVRLTRRFRGEGERDLASHMFARRVAATQMAVVTTVGIAHPQQRHALACRRAPIAGGRP